MAKSEKLKRLEALEEYLTRLEELLTVARSFHWGVSFDGGMIHVSVPRTYDNVISYSLLPVGNISDSALWELELVINQHREEVEAEARKNKLREQAYAKLTPEEIEALR